MSGLKYTIIYTNSDEERICFGPFSVEEAQRIIKRPEQLPQHPSFQWDIDEEHVTWERYEDDQCWWAWRTEQGESLTVEVLYAGL